MAKKRITEDQVKKILQEVANGAKPPVLAKKYGFSLGTFYNWKNKMGIPKPDGSAPAAPAKKVAAKKAPAKKAAAKKPAAKKAVAKKAPAKKVAAKKPAVKKAVAKKAPAKKVASKKPAARKAAPKKARASAEAKLQAEIAKRQKQINTIEGQITRLKVRYAEAILKSVK